MSASTSSSPSKAKRPGGGSIQGPRPQPLIVSPAAAEASRPTKKPRVVAGGGGDMGPVIVYELTPRVVHTRPEEFRAIVQKLTGKQSTATATVAAPSDSTVTLPDLVAGGRAGESGAAAAATAADPLVLALGQQRQPAPPAIDDDYSPLLPPPSPAAAFLLSPSSLFFSPTTMQALQELGILF